MCSGAKYTCTHAFLLSLGEEQGEEEDMSHHHAIKAQEKMPPSVGCQGQGVSLPCLVCCHRHPLHTHKAPKRCSNCNTISHSCWVAQKAFILWLSVVAKCGPGNYKGFGWGKRHLVTAGSTKSYSVRVFIWVHAIQPAQCFPNYLEWAPTFTFSLSFPSLIPLSPRF